MTSNVASGSLQVVMIIAFAISILAAVHKRMVVTICLVLVSAACYVGLLSIYDKRSEFWEAILMTWVFLLFLTVVLLVSGILRGPAPTEVASRSPAPKRA